MSSNPTVRLPHVQKLTWQSANSSSPPVPHLQQQQQQQLWSTNSSLKCLQHKQPNPSTPSISFSLFFIQRPIFHHVYLSFSLLYKYEISHLIISNTATLSHSKRQNKKKTKKIKTGKLSQIHRQSNNGVYAVSETGSDLYRCVNHGHGAEGLVPCGIGFRGLGSPFHLEHRADVAEASLPLHRHQLHHHQHRRFLQAPHEDRRRSGAGDGSADSCASCEGLRWSTDPRLQWCVRKRRRFEWRRTRIQCWLRCGGEESDGQRWWWGCGGGVEAVREERFNGAFVFE